MRWGEPGGSQEGQEGERKETGRRQDGDRMEPGGRQEGARRGRAHCIVVLLWYCNSSPTMKAVSPATESCRASTCVLIRHPRAHTHTHTHTACALPRSRARACSRTPKAHKHTRAHKHANAHAHRCATPPCPRGSNLATRLRCIRDRRASKNSLDI